MKKYFLTAMLSFSLFAALLTGCGNADNKSSEKETDSVSTDSDAGSEHSDQDESISEESSDRKTSWVIKSATYLDTYDLSEETLIYEYDENGDCIKIDGFSNGDILTYSYDYSDDGCVTVGMYYSGKDVLDNDRNDPLFNTFASYAHVATDTPASTTDTSASVEPQEPQQVENKLMYEYKFDDKGNLIYCYGESKYLYDDDNKILAFYNVGENGQAHQAAVFAYDENGNLTAVCNPDDDSECMKYTYDSDGNMTVEILWDWEEKHEYIYDENGNIEKINWYESDGHDEEGNVKYLDIPSMTITYEWEQLDGIKHNKLNCPLIDMRNYY